jgi:hypothetical protein
MAALETDPKKVSGLCFPASFPPSPAAPPSPPPSCSFSFVLFLFCLRLRLRLPHLYLILRSFRSSVCCVSSCLSHALPYLVCLSCHPSYAAHVSPPPTLADDVIASRRQVLKKYQRPRDFKRKAGGGVDGLDPAEILSGRRHVHCSLITHHSSLLTPHSSLLTPRSSLLTPHSSLLSALCSLLSASSAICSLRCVGGVVAIVIAPVVVGL